MKACVIALSMLAAPATGFLSAQIVHQSPFICDMSMLTAADRERKEEIGGALASRLRAVHELPTGYEFVMPGDSTTIQLVIEWLVTERLCCPFFDFELRIDREGGPTALRLTGRKGTKEFIRADFGRWIK